MKALPVKTKLLWITSGLFLLIVLTLSLSLWWGLSDKNKILSAQVDDTLHQEISQKLVPVIVNKLINEGCHIKGDSEVKKIVNSVELATEIDWHTEYLEAILSIKIVNGIKGAINHINKYSSNHTESIITENKVTAETFLSNVDSAIVMHNTSTQFADGGEFGFGAEIGISNQKLHARGPMGLEAMTTTTWIVTGNGQIRS